MLEPAEISAFSLPVGDQGAAVSGTISEISDGTATIAVAAVSGTTVTSLAATFTATQGATVKVGSTEQTSGTTTNDYTNPVVFTVSKDGMATTTYTVTVTVAP